MITTIIEKHILLEDRIDFLRDNFAEKLTMVARRKPREQQDNTIFDYILATDPSRNKIYAQWIIKQYLRDARLISEDFYKIKNALGVFEAYKTRLDLKYRDIN